MEIHLRTTKQTQVIELNGELDEQSAPQAQTSILPLATPGCKIVLDMSKVTFMSSAGLRLLLQVYRAIAGKGGKVVLVGLSDNLADTMSITGFLDLVAHYPTLEAGLKAVARTGRDL
jgi:anti-sigma B factor antagonist